MTQGQVQLARKKLSSIQVLLGTLAGRTHAEPDSRLATHSWWGGAGEVVSP